MHANFHPVFPQVSVDKNDLSSRLIVDVEGCELTDEDINIIKNKFVGGVILFTRNYKNLQQLKKLTAEIHDIKPEIKIAVDHEGGRVQRFREGFTIIPPMDTLGKIYKKNSQLGINTSIALAEIMAEELISVGVDFSFAPVLDINFGNSQIIGNRAFSANPQDVLDLAKAFNQGLHNAGMPSVGKHFPGHGFVSADSHLDLPIDNRSLAEIENSELIPYRNHQHIYLDAVMIAHICYKNIDSNPAGYSKFWLDYLRKNLNFNGAIFSDDLSMNGAKSAGDNVQLRAHRALSAGCDYLIICNDRVSVSEYLNIL